MTSNREVGQRERRRERWTTCLVRYSSTVRTDRNGRKDGGEGGRHPSNVPDYAYAIGTVNFTGDMPIILTVDGPSLGGFVSLATVTTSELWKIGQAKPHDFIRFKEFTAEEAIEQLYRQEQLLQSLA